MLKAARMSFDAAKKDIILFAVLNSAIYAALLLIFKYAGLLHIWGLRMVDYVVLTLLSLYQVHHWIRKTHGYVPFLQAFFTILFTGALSFALFAAFLFFYSFRDPYITELYVASSKGDSRISPAIIILFEGGGGSLIVALIASFYAARFEDGELSS